MAESLGVLVAFSAGLFSFLSPCVLPLFPSYLSFVTGMSVDRLASDVSLSERALVMLHSLAFIAGFTVVFVSLGASFSAAGQFLLDYRDWIRIGGGVLIVIFGLYIAGVLAHVKNRHIVGLLTGAVIGYLMRPSAPFIGQLPFQIVITAGATLQGADPMHLDLARTSFWYVAVGAILGVCGSIVLGDRLVGQRQSETLSRIVGVLGRTKQLQIRSKPAGFLGSFAVGLTFAIGWTPCVGPILGAILTLASNEKTVSQGVGLLLAYSAGLGVPFLAFSAGLGVFLRLFKRYRPLIHTVERAAGVLLVVVGVLVATNYYIVLNSWTISLTPEWLLKRL